MMNTFKRVCSDTFLLTLATVLQLGSITSQSSSERGGENILRSVTLSQPQILSLADVEADGLSLACSEPSVPAVDLLVRLVIIKGFLR